jgi:hypothetical protein
MACPVSSAVGDPPNRRANPEEHPAITFVPFITLLDPRCLPHRVYA